MGTGAIAELESWFVDRVDHVAGFAVASGTQALQAALMAAGIGPHSSGRTARLRLVGRAGRDSGRRSDTHLV